jgi:hypothetical protein
MKQQMWVQVLVSDKHATVLRRMDDRDELEEAIIDAVRYGRGDAGG